MMLVLLLLQPHISGPLPLHCSPMNSLNSACRTHRAFFLLYTIVFAAVSALNTHTPWHPTISPPSSLLCCKLLMEYTHACASYHPFYTPSLPEAFPDDPISSRPSLSFVIASCFFSFLVTVSVCVFALDVCLFAILSSFSHWNASVMEVKDLFYTERLTFTNTMSDIQYMFIE